MLVFIFIYYHIGIDLAIQEIPCRVIGRGFCYTSCTVRGKNYLLPLIATCAAICKRGKLISITVKINIALYMLGVKCIATDNTLVAVPFRRQIISSAHYILIAINRNRTVFFGIIEAVVL